LDQATRSRLLESIAADRLVVLCGAGLSIGPPSNLPSAWEIAQACHDKYCNTVEPTLDPLLKDDLEALAEYFAQQGTLTTSFIRTMVPWDKFVRPYNRGHEALADFLICRAVFAVLSANYDELIEVPARQSGADLEVALDGDQAIVHASNHAPFLKFHGCARDRDHTVWTKSQLTSDAVIAGRIEKSSNWMRANLREKDLLVIGFWSDWSYLNEIVESALKDVTPLSVTIVDPIDVADLENKAPELWAIAHTDGVTFWHIQESGAELLDALRKEFSFMFLRQVLEQGRASIEAEIGKQYDQVWLDMSPMDQHELYRWRRDAEGVSSDRPPRRKSPEANELLGHFHLLLRSKGAVVSGDGYILDNKIVRVVNGSGRFLSTVQGDMVEPPVASEIDLVVCVGSYDLGLPGNIVREGEPGSVLRPASAGQFVTHQDARELLEI